MFDELLSLHSLQKNIKEKGLKKVEGGYPTIERMLDSDRSIGNERMEIEGETAVSRTRDSNKGAVFSNVKETQQEDMDTMATSHSQQPTSSGAEYTQTQS